LGIDSKNLKKEELDKKDLAHYSRGTTEIWYNWPFMGFGELEGIANRGDYDLSVHQKASGRDLSYFDEESKEKFIPYVIEPSVGVGRAMLAFLLDSYREDEKRVYLKLHPKLAPYKVAVFPLLANKKELVDKARSMYQDLRKNMMVAWDDRGNIGKRYFAQDEIGTPFCITVDFQTLEDDTVTVRNRDTGKQDRISISGFPAYYNDKASKY
jgi:glycyl-tRNA synthetase